MPKNCRRLGHLSLSVTGKMDYGHFINTLSPEVSRKQVGRLMSRLMEKGNMVGQKRKN